MKELLRDLKYARLTAEVIGQFLQEYEKLIGFCGKHPWSKP